MRSKKNDRQRNRNLFIPMRSKVTRETREAKGGNFLLQHYLVCDHGEVGGLAEMLDGVARNVLAAESCLDWLQESAIEQNAVELLSS